MSHGAEPGEQPGLRGGAGIAGVDPFAFCWVQVCRVICRRISAIAFGLEQGL